VYTLPARKDCNFEPLGPEAPLAFVNPASSLVLFVVGAISATCHNFSTRQLPPATSTKSPSLQILAVDPQPALLSTTVSCWPSWPGSIGEQKASQSLPALYSWRSRTAVGFTLEVRRRRTPSFKESAPCPCQRIALGVPETRHGLEMSNSTRCCCRVQSSCEHAPTGAACGCVGPHRAPRIALAHSLCTALDYRSGVDPCQWMAL